MAFALGSSHDAAGQAPPANPPLGLEEVLASVEAHYPLLAAAQAQRDVAAGSLLAAEGQFDTQLVLQGDLRPEGFYETYEGDALLEQPTTRWGSRFYLGYQIGRGSFASYDGARQTDDAGEFRGGVELPLLRGRRIDKPRAALARAELDLARVEPELALQRIGFLRDAAISYWRWVAKGLEVAVAERLLGVAEERQAQLEGRVRRGLLPSIDLVDNERLIVDRKIRLLANQRDAEQAAITLSLFLRDDAGAPRIPGRADLPADFPAEEAPDPLAFTRDLDRARQDHPLLRSFALRRDQAEVELALARNDGLPELDLLVEGSRDVGDALPGISTLGSVSPSPRSETELKAKIRIGLPLQRRDARGRMRSASARLSRLDNEARFAQEQIEADIRRAMTGLETAYAQAEAARENLALAERMRRAEQRRLGLGTSNLIDVNIREREAADAADALIEAQAAYFGAVAAYRAAVAVDF